MASIPVSHEASAPAGETLEERFQRLRTAWYRATAVLSSMDAAAEHPAYQEIIRMGEKVVPLLLRNMEKNETHWFIALSKITGVQPIPREAAGKIPRMVEAWLAWGKEHGYR